MHTLGSKGDVVKVTNKNGRELLYKVKTELPYDATGHLFSLLTKTTRIGKTSAGSDSNRTKVTKPN